MSQQLASQLPKPASSGSLPITRTLFQRLQVSLSTTGHSQGYSEHGMQVDQSCDCHYDVTAYALSHALYIIMSD